MTTDLRLAPVAAALWVGAVVGLHASLGPALVTCTTLAVLVAALATRRRHPSGVWAMALILGALLAACRVDAASPQAVAADLANSGLVRFEAVIDGEPRAVERDAPGALEVQQMMRAQVTIVRIRTARNDWHVSVPATLQWPPARRVPVVGERVRGAALLHPDDVARRSAYRVSVRGAIEHLQAPSRGTALATLVREGLARASRAARGGDGETLLPGLVLGDTRAQSARLVDDLRVSGLSHLTAVSGANLAIVVAALVWAMRRTRLRALHRHVVTAAGIGAFVVVVHPQPSVVRAAVMGAIGVFAAATGRTRASASVLWLSVVVLLVVDPFLAWQYGFALSVAATAGLIVLRPFLAPHLPQGRLGAAIAVTLSAQLATMPVLLAMGRPPTWLSVPANLLCEPLVAPATISGFVAALLAALSLLPIPVVSQGLLLLASLAALPGVFLAALIARIAAFGAGTGLAIAPITSVAAFAMVSVCVGVLVRAGVRPRRIFALAVAYMLVSSCAPQVIHRWPVGDWWYAMCDVGQGDASVFSLGAGDAIVVDAGPDPARVRSCLRQLGVHRVSALFLTHFHADHVEGVPGVLAQAAVDRVYVTPLREPAIEWQRVRAALRMPMQEVRAGEALSFGATQVRILWPDPARLDGTPNNASLVLDVARNGVHVLMTGDADAAAQAALTLPVRGYAVLKVPHHGSQYQDPGFVGRVAPSLALVSVGEGNDYGHPAVSTMATMRARGIRVLRTDLDGAVSVAVRGGALAIGSLSG